jgi:hypothetical protein
MRDQDLEDEVDNVSILMEDEWLHNQVSGWTGNQLPTSKPALSDADIKVLRSKHVFLCDFSDEFICNTSIGDLMKIELTSMKARELERTKDADDKLALNKIALATTFTSVPAGSDNRWSCLHPGRFLGGAACSTAKLWLAAKDQMGSSFAPPVGNYDMGSVGLAGYVSSKGWAELANPASTSVADPEPFYPKDPGSGSGIWDDFFFQIPDLGSWILTTSQIQDFTIKNVEKQEKLNFV